MEEHENKFSELGIGEHGAFSLVSYIYKEIILAICIATYKLYKR